MYASDMPLQWEFTSLECYIDFIAKLFVVQKIVRYDEFVITVYKTSLSISSFEELFP